MRTMHAALAAVADRLGLAQIQPNADGFAEIVVADVLPIFLRQADEYELELSARLTELDGHLSPALITELMRWNARFHGLRFALEADRPGIVLGRRLDIRTLGEARIAEAVEAFLYAAADWRRHGAEALVQRVMRHGQTGGEAFPPGLRL